MAVTAEDYDTPLTKDGWMKLRTLTELKHLNVGISAANELPLDELSARASAVRNSNLPLSLNRVGTAGRVSVFMWIAN